MWNCKIFRQFWSVAVGMCGMMSGSRCSPSPNHVTAQIGGEFANSNVNTAMDIMAMSHYASLTQPTPSTPAFYARCMQNIPTFIWYWSACSFHRTDAGTCTTDTVGIHCQPYRANRFLSLRIRSIRSCSTARMIGSALFLDGK